MKKRLRIEFLALTNKAGQKRDVQDPNEYRGAIEEAQRQQIQEEEKFREVDVELDQHDDIFQLTRAYLHVVIESGKVTEVKGVLGLEVTNVAFDTTITVSDNGQLAIPYAVMVHNQLDSSNARVYSGDRQPAGFTVRATDVVGVPLDMALGVHEFALVVMGTS